MATTYTITRPNAASYDFDIALDTAFAVAEKFPSALSSSWKKLSAASYSTAMRAD